MHRGGGSALAICGLDRQIISSLPRFRTENQGTCKHHVFLAQRDCPLLWILQFCVLQLWFSSHWCTQGTRQSIFASRGPAGLECSSLRCDFFGIIIIFFSTSEDKKKVKGCGGDSRALLCFCLIVIGHWGNTTSWQMLITCYYFKNWNCCVVYTQALTVCVAHLKILSERASQQRQPFPFPATQCWSVCFPGPAWSFCLLPRRGVPGSTPQSPTKWAIGENRNSFGLGLMVEREQRRWRCALAFSWPRKRVMASPTILACRPNAPIPNLLLIVSHLQWITHHI